MNLQMKMNYKNQKQIKKLYGKHLGKEIAYGRNLVKLMKEKYQPERLNPEDHIVEANDMVCDSPNNGNK